MKKLDKRINELNQTLKKRQNEYEVIKDNFYKLEKEIVICNSFFIKRFLKGVMRNISKLIDFEYYVNILKKKEIIILHKLIKKLSKIKNIEVELKYLLEQKVKRKEYILSNIIYSEELRAEVINLNRQCELDKRKIMILEHGLLRYLERVKGIDIEKKRWFQRN